MLLILTAKKVAVCAIESPAVPAMVTNLAPVGVTKATAVIVTAGLCSPQQNSNNQN